MIHSHGSTVRKRESDGFLVIEEPNALEIRGPVGLSLRVELSRFGTPFADPICPNPENFRDVSLMYAALADEWETFAAKRKEKANA